MRRNKLDEKEYAELADQFGIPSSSVKSIIASYFSVIVTDARRLPFNTKTKIYSKDKFDDIVKIVNIPFIGRIGPSYTRYLKWRRNESKNIAQRERDDYKVRLTPEDIDEIAKKILSGESVEINKRKPNEMYDRVWVVGKNGKKMAHQVIPKK